MAEVFDSYNPEQDIVTYLEAFNKHCDAHSVPKADRACHIGKFLPDNFMYLFSTQIQADEDWDKCQKFLKSAFFADKVDSIGKVRTNMPLTWFYLDRYEKLFMRQLNPKTMLPKQKFLPEFDFYSSQVMHYNYITPFTRFRDIKTLFPRSFLLALDHVTELRGEQSILLGISGPNGLDVQRSERLWDALMWYLMHEDTSSDMPLMDGGSPPNGNALEGIRQVQPLEGVRQIQPLQSKNNNELPRKKQPVPAVEPKEESVQQKPQAANGATAAAEDHCLFCGVGSHRLADCHYVELFVNRGTLIRRPNGDITDQNNRPVTKYIPRFIMDSLHFYQYMGSALETTYGKTILTIPEDDPAKMASVASLSLSEDAVNMKFKVSPIDFLAISPDLCDKMIADLIQDGPVGSLQQPFNLRPTLNRLIEDKIDELWDLVPESNRSGLALYCNGQRMESYQISEKAYETIDWETAKARGMQIFQSADEVVGHWPQEVLDKITKTSRFKGFVPLNLTVGSPVANSTIGLTCAVIEGFKNDLGYELMLGEPFVSLALAGKTDDENDFSRLLPPKILRSS
ncbi:hypothetical protein TRVA0_018S02168 [Trichomonascus vanleenenianus]|uniref:uncharacterized protein n=1 Tax=Trichomonascus vanleenenianus TaxID=2268995 RepID=UPI003ECB5C38